MNKPHEAVLRPNPDWAKLPLFDRTGWRRVRFGDVVENVNETERDPVSAGIERFVGLEHLAPGSLHVREWGNVSDGTTFSRRCRPGQLLFGKRRAYQRKVAVADFDAVVSGDIYVLAPKGAGLLPELLPFVCMSERFFQHAVGTSAGSLSPRTNWGSLARFEFDLPPLDQQRRITEILLAADNALERCRATGEQIESTRGEALAARIRSASEGASQFRIDQLAPHGERALRTGPFGSKLKAECFAPEGIPIINISAIGDIGVDEKGLLFLKRSVVDRFRSYLVRSGDLVFSRVAEIGRCMLIDGNYAGSMISSNLIRIRIDPEKVAPRYMLLLLRYCADLQNQIRQVTSTGGRVLVNGSTLSELKFSIPDASTQEEIIERAEQFDLTIREYDRAGEELSRMASKLRHGLL